MPNITRPQLPKGTRDFLPGDMLRRQYVFDQVTAVFQIFGFEPIQTPVLELRDTLMSKYGDEATKLIYYAQHNEGNEELALRYDLTVPLARYFAQHESELPLPFKRYHIAPVWRAERKQRGRYREFYQCDADIVGVAGMEADAEIVSLIAMAIERLGFADFTIKVNHRRLLTGIGQYAGVTGEALGSLYRTIDKTDKIGLDGVREEFRKDGLPEESIARMIPLLESTQQATDIPASLSLIDSLHSTFAESPDALAGLIELESLLKIVTALQVASPRVSLDFTMVRGLSYYTGPIFETVLLSDDPEERVGSVSGGGRYNDLLGLFRKESLPTVGASLGIERLIDLINTRGLFPASTRQTVVQVLVTVFNADTRTVSLNLIAALRAEGIRSELYMQDKAVGKQINYADKKGIPVIALLGPDEIVAGKIKLKRLSDGVEQVIDTAHAPAAIRALLE